MTLLTEAPAGRHFAQFHRDRDSLSDSLALFLQGGIVRGHIPVVIATPELTDNIVQRMSADDFQPNALSGSGQLELIDAAGLMAQFMADGLPWARFRATLEPVLSRVQAFGRRIRLFSEMGSMLWKDGNTEGAIRVEEHWNALSRLYMFSLYCGYTLDTHSEQSYSGPLEDVGHLHTDILGTEEDERFGNALDRASKEIFGITLSQMAGMTNHDGARRFPSGQRTMLWVTRNLPLSTAQLAERARRYFQETPPGRI